MTTRNPSLERLEKARSASAKKAPHYLECPYEYADAAALQALERGQATPEQQVRALKWLVHTAANVYDLEFQVEGDRESHFAAGRRFVGLQIVKLCNLSLNKLARGN